MRRSPDRSILLYRGQQCGHHSGAGRKSTIPYPPSQCVIGEREVLIALRDLEIRCGDIAVEPRLGGLGSLFATTTLPTAPREDWWIKLREHRISLRSTHALGRRCRPLPAPVAPPFGLMIPEDTSFQHWLAVGVADSAIPEAFCCRAGEGLAASRAASSTSMLPVSGLGRTRPATSTGTLAAALAAPAPTPGAPSTDRRRSGGRERHSDRL